MTIAAGIDVGTGTVKAVLFRAERDKTEWLSRAVDAGVAGDRPSVSQAAREHFMDQHVCRLDSDADHARQHENHRIRSVVWSRSQLVQTRLLDGSGLLSDEA